MSFPLEEKPEKKLPFPESLANKKFDTVHIIDSEQQSNLNNLSPGLKYGAPTIAGSVQVSPLLRRGQNSKYNLSFTDSNLKVI